jgi:hypothetical protein
LPDFIKESVAAAIAREGKDYIRVIQALPAETTVQGTAWLQGIVDAAVAEALEAMG